MSILFGKHDSRGYNFYILPCLLYLSANKLLNLTIQLPDGSQLILPQNTQTREFSPPFKPAKEVFDLCVYISLRLPVTQLQAVLSASFGIYWGIWAYKSFHDYKSFHKTYNN